MSDISKSFAYLQETIPQWLQDITNVEERVLSMQHDMTRVLVSQSPFVESRTGSMDSIRPEKLDIVAEEITPSNNFPTNPLGSRKRKSPSVASGPSGPTKYRPRTMVVVSYDGDMQKSFELLVRGLATGRNMLRKAKMEARMAELAAIAGSSEDEDDNDDEEEEEEEENIMSKISYRPHMTSMRLRAAAARRGGRNGLNGGPTPPAELFETTDKTLEQAQELCEKSAHLSLREGDCRNELKLVRRHLENVLSTAKTEVIRYTASPPQRTQALQDHDTSDTSVPSVEPSYKRHFPSISAPKPVPEQESKLVPVTTQSTIRAPAASTVVASKTTDIEVDDDDEDEDMDFVMPPVRFTSRRAACA
ncbi:uncharacterized protein EKO05_0009229 [Ascochyta rabiei]|uniref:Uncharacterized protein n=1 Tax=Didymella rabiei TaxID=5454 RepID=A0A163IP95_DIDRA|nr:uncharacterized protein EKO05_0009229 [Ascochyta rabiei]KZM25862.1 hypothetical protein ST47_g3015 [Ascochyta rabiei]UPX18949.1 hypothetical protein EKO05_0009229 [Ascochyta rabiei]